MARYIDVNEIKFTGAVFEDRNNEIYIKLSDVKQSIEQTPTADVVEVKHGYWQHFQEIKMKQISGKVSVCLPKYHTQCSCCKHCFIVVSKTHFKYCPECGSEMNGGESQ